MHKIIVSIFFGLFLVSSSCLANDSKIITVKLKSGTYKLKSTKYLEPVIFKVVKKDLSNYKTPLSSFMSFYSSMQNGDYEWWWNSWTVKSKETMTEEYEKLNLGKSEFISKWSNDFKKIERIKIKGMIEKVPPKNYTIILLEKVYNSGKISPRYTVLENIGNEWYCTQELSSSPYINIENIELIIDTNMGRVELAE